jgi:hypothetical protein
MNDNSVDPKIGWFELLLIIVVFGGFTVLVFGAALMGK